MKTLSLLQWPRSAPSPKRLEFLLLEAEACLQPWLLIKCCNLHVKISVVDRTFTETDILESDVLLHALGRV